jgi:ATP-dependent Clp protease protease subunit
VATIEADSTRDRWFTAEQARDYGFVDEIVTDAALILPGRARAIGSGDGIPSGGRREGTS